MSSSSPRFDKIILEKIGPKFRSRIYLERKWVGGSSARIRLENVISEALSQPWSALASWAGMDALYNCLNEAGKLYEFHDKTMPGDGWHPLTNLEKHMRQHPSSKYFEIKQQGSSYTTTRPRRRSRQRSSSRRRPKRSRRQSSSRRLQSSSRR